MLLQVQFPEITSPGAVYSETSYPFPPTGSHTHTYTFTSDSQVEGTFTLTATDLATNFSTTTITIVRDITPPVASGDAPAWGNPWENSPDIYWSASDDESCVSYAELWYRLDGGSWKYEQQGYSPGDIFPFHFYSWEGDGLYEFSIVGVDCVGNREAHAVDAFSRIESVAPDLVVEPLKQEYIDVIPLRWSATDNGSGVAWYGLSR
jgi:hypothetical protein